MRPDGFRRQAAALAGQFRWQADPQGRLNAGRVVVAGMGGSGMAGAFAALALEGSTEVQVLRGSSLPDWVTPADQLLCVSFSGETWETLAVWHEAGARGLSRAAVASGGTLLDQAREAGLPSCAVPQGLAPRSSLGYMVRAVCSLLPGTEPDFEAAAAHLESIGEDPAEAVQLAEHLRGGLPVLLTWGDRLGLAAARWAADLAENAKLPSMLWNFPEAAHNSIMALSPEAGHNFPLRPLVLGTPLTARAREVMDSVQELLQESAAPCAKLDGGHAVPWIDALGLAYVGTWVSVNLAEAQGVDAAAIDFLNRLKALLST